MKGLRQTLTMLTCLLLAASCGDACDGGSSSGENGVNNGGVDVFVDSEGNSCDDPTPCGNCDHDCRPAGNPFVTGGGGGGDGVGDGSGTGGGDGSGTGSGGGTGDGTGGGDGSGGEGGTGSGGGGTGGTGTGTGGGNGTDQTVCLDIDVSLERAIPTVVLLIDQSGSMQEPFGDGMNRLEAAYAGLMDPVDGLIAELQASFRIGLALYTSYSRGDTCPDLSDVRPELNNYDPINRVFSIAEPESDTPTGESIEGVMRMFDEHPDQGKKLLLLATDGEPDTCAVPNPQNGQPEAIAAAKAAYQQGVETVVLSVGDDVGRPHLQDLANAGAGLAVGGAQNATFYQANDGNALKLQMRGIIQNAQSCIFRVLGGVVDPGILDFATVTLDGNVLGYNDPHGWTYHQDRKSCHGSKQCIELVGSACQQLQDGMNHVVHGDFLCVYYDPETGSGGGGGGDGTGGTGTGDGSGGSTGGSGGGSGGPGMCVSASGSCGYDGDCCSGICGAGTCVVN